MFYNKNIIQVKMDPFKNNIKQLKIIVGETLSKAG